MIFITSAAYVSGELQSEFGRLPPAFLPVGNKRLFELQLRLLRAKFENETIYLTLPESYVIAKRDLKNLDRWNVEILHIPDGLSLADSILFAINTAGCYEEVVRILHGDTWVSALPDIDDCLCVDTTADDYDWHVDDGIEGDAKARVWCGYFSFASVRRLTRCLVAARGSFEGAVVAYDAEEGLVRVEATDWLDFGHVNTFYRSRARSTTQRSFNELVISDRKVQKTGNPLLKIQAEAKWYEALPSDLRVYVPQLICHGIRDKGYGYELEYMCMAPLNELFVHGNVSRAMWSRVFLHISQWFKRAENSAQNIVYKVDDIAADIDGLLRQKTSERLATYARDCGLDLTAATRLNGKVLPSIQNVMEACVNRAEAIPLVHGIAHGDLCFSNILFDTRGDCIKIIDPRGVNYRGDFTLVGDLRYDLAKLSHSVLGLYDFIIADAFDVDSGTGTDFEFTIHSDEKVAEIQSLFAKMPLLNGLTGKQLAPINVLLFLSMLPLHADTPRRQRAMLANALRLYHEMDCQA